MFYNILNNLYVITKMLIIFPIDFVIYNADQVFKMRYLQNDAMHYRDFVQTISFQPI